MASKITTDNPKHHKYVVVNKVERKKFVKRFIRLVSMFIPGVEYDGHGWRCNNSGIFSSCHPYLAKGMKVIYDDCNHRSYRVMVKTMSGWQFVKETGSYCINPHRRYSPAKFKSFRRLIRQCYVSRWNDVKHYKRSFAY